MTVMTVMTLNTLTTQVTLTTLMTLLNLPSDLTSTKPPSDVHVGEGNVMVTDLAEEGAKRFKEVCSAPSTSTLTDTTHAGRHTQRAGKTRCPGPLPGLPVNNEKNRLFVHRHNHTV
jgi:hypothetical protein